MWRWVRLASCLFTLGSVEAVEVETHLSQPAITTAALLELHIAVTAPIDHRVVLPEETWDFGGFTLLKKSPTRREYVEEQGFRHSARYTLEPFLPGDYTIPAWAIGFRQGNGPIQFTATDPLTIPVYSVLGSDPAKAELMDIIETPSTPWHQRLRTAMIAAALGYGVLLLFVLRQILKPKKAPRPPPFSLKHQRLIALREMIGQPNPSCSELVHHVDFTRRHSAFDPLWEELERFNFSNSEPEPQELKRLIEKFLHYLQYPGSAA